MRRLSAAILFEACGDPLLSLRWSSAAILFEGCDATSADVTRTLTLRDTEVHAEVLHFAEGVTDAQKTAALASLASHGIIAR